MWTEVSSAEASIPSERLQVRFGAKEIRLAVESLPPRKEVVTPDLRQRNGRLLRNDAVGLQNGRTALESYVDLLRGDGSVLSQLSRTGCPYILVLDPTATIGARWLANLRRNEL